jgi:hypothetical protein
MGVALLITADTLPLGDLFRRRFEGNTDRIKVREIQKPVFHRHSIRSHQGTEANYWSLNTPLVSF